MSGTRRLIDLLEKAPALPGPGRRETPAQRFIRAATHASSIASLLHALPGLSLLPAGMAAVLVTLPVPAPQSRQEAVLGLLRAHMDRMAAVCGVTLRYAEQE